MLKRNIFDLFYAENGFQLGLLYKTTDKFSQHVYEKEDLMFKLDLPEKYHPPDPISSKLFFIFTVQIAVFPCISILVLPVSIITYV